VQGNATTKQQGSISKGTPVAPQPSGWGVFFCLRFLLGNWLEMALLLFGLVLIWLGSDRA